MTRAAEHRLINPRTLTPASVPLSMCLAWLACACRDVRPDDQRPYLLLGSCLAALFGGLVLFEPRSLPAYQVAFVLGILGIALRVATGSSCAASRSTPDS